MVSGLISDRFGRLIAIRCASTVWVSGTIVSICVYNIQMVMASRAIKGFAVGIFSSILPVYASEVFPLNKKGLATSIMQSSLTWGIMLMFYLSYFCNFMGNDNAFRLAWGLEMLPGLSLLFCSFLIPESPKWLASRSHWRKASDIMEKLRNNAAQNSNELPIAGAGNDEAPASSADNNLHNIEDVLDNFENNAKKCTYLDLFRKNLRRHLLIGIATQAFTQLSGIGFLMYYLIYICEMIGLTGDTKILSASIQYVINVLFTIFPILWLDKMRRKDVLVFGASALGLCISSIGCIMGIYGHSVPPLGGNESVVWEITGTTGSLCLALCFLFVAIFASTLSCAAWLYTNEVFPVKAKAKGSAICMSVSWTINFTLTFLAPISLKHIKWITFLLFGAFCITGAFVMGFCFPETYGLTEEQIDNLYRKRGEDGEIIQNEEDGEIPDRDTIIDDENEERKKTMNVPMNNLQEKITLDESRVDEPGLDNVSRLGQKTLISERSKNSIPSHVSNNFPDVHNIIKNNSSDDSTTNSALHNNNNNNKNSELQNMSPFLKKMGGPFENESDLDFLEQNVEGTGADVNDNSTTYTDGLINHYYNQNSGYSPFLNQYTYSPPK